MPFELHPETILPVDAHQATLIGRAWLPEPVAGPAVVLVRGQDVIDISGFAPTVSTLLEKSGLVQELATLEGPLIGSVSALLANSSADRRDPASRISDSHRSAGDQGLRGDLCGQHAGAGH